MEEDKKFDPDWVERDTLKRFDEFVKDFEFIYEAKCTSSAGDAGHRNGQNEWLEQDRRKQFLGLYVIPRFGRFTLRNASFRAK